VQVSQMEGRWFCLRRPLLATCLHSSLADMTARVREGGNKRQPPERASLACGGSKSVRYYVWFALAQGDGISMSLGGAMKTANGWFRRATWTFKLTSICHKVNAAALASVSQLRNQHHKTAVVAPKRAHQHWPGWRAQGVAQSTEREVVLSSGLIDCSPLGRREGPLVCLGQTARARARASARSRGRGSSGRPDSRVATALSWAERPERRIQVNLRLIGPEHLAPRKLRFRSPAPGARPRELPPSGPARGARQFP